MPPVRAYLRARWDRGLLASECEDAAQEVFLRCFTEAGPLDRLERVSEGGFRGFLYGVTRNVAREVEQERSRRRHDGSGLEDVEAQDARLSTVFDRSFARQVMREARARFEERMQGGDEDSRFRLEILRLRFDEDLPVREIAQRGGREAARVHKEYARARREFREALFEVVGEQDPRRTDSEVEESARRLIQLLG